MVRDFVHTCGGTFAYIIWLEILLQVSAWIINVLFTMCPWNLFLLSMLFISM